MAHQAKLVVVVGAGASGLTTIKCLKEEGLYVVCYEKSDSIGGLWNYREQDIDGISSVMKSTVCNTSKELMAFSDFPPPRDFPNYMPHKYVLGYLEKYSEAFDLKRHVKFKHEVLRILPTADNYRTGRWEVTVRDHAKHRTMVEVFDGVAVCIGRFGFPKYPPFPSLEIYKGIVMHTHNLKRCDPFRDLKVLVIGAGNSGADAAVYLSSVAEQVFGAVFPICEMQARWFAQVLNKKVAFPDKGDIINDITLNSELEAKAYPPSGRNCMQVHVIPYLNELASLIGVKPNFAKMILQDPKLFWACVCGPCLPYQYRLEGYHQWTGAREAILSYKGRVLAPLKTRKEYVRRSVVST